MRIGFLTHQWPGARLGGLGAYTLHCAHALAEAGHEAHVFTFTLPTDVRAGLPNGIIMHEVEDLAHRSQSGQLAGPLAAAIHSGGEAAYRLAMGWLLCQAVRKYHLQKPLDMIEAPECEALHLPLLFDPLPDVAMITHIHSGAAIRRAGNGEGATPEALAIEAFEFAAMAAADAICAPTVQVVSDTRQFFPALVDVSIVPSPFRIPTNLAQTEPPAGGPILYIGRLEHNKGVHLLAHALNIFLPRCADATVRLAGPDTATAPDGGSMAMWMRKQLHPGLHQRVLFLGEQTSEQIAGHLRDASFCVVPSLFENYSFVCCEAMAAGRGIVVSSQTGAAELVDGAGLTFERNNAEALAAKLEELWRDRPRVAELSSKAYRRARNALGVQVTIPMRIAFYQAAIETLKAKGRRSWSDHLSALPTKYATAFAAPLIGLSGVLSGVASPASPTPGTRLLRIMERIAAESSSPAQIYLYGAGRHTSRLLAEKYLWEQKGHRVIGLIDDHPRFGQNPEHLGLPVVSCADFARGASPATAIVLSTDTFQDQFWDKPRHCAPWVLRCIDSTSDLPANFISATCDEINPGRFRPFRAMRFLLFTTQGGAVLRPGLSY